MRCLFLLLSFLFFLPTPVVGQVFMAGVGGPEEPGVNKEWVRLRGRLEQHLGVYQYWLNATCDLSEEQRQLVSAACKETYTRAEGRFNPKPPEVKEGDPEAEKQQVLFAIASFTMDEFPSTPIIFTGSASAAPSAFDQQFCEAIDKILTPAQRELLAKETASRGKLVHDGCKHRVLDTIDDLMYLKRSQRETIAQKLEDLQPQFTNALYTFHVNWKDVKSKLLDEEDWFPRDVLTSDQLARAKSLRPNEMSNPVDQIDSKCSDEEFQSRVDKNIEQSWSKYQQHLAVILDYYRDQLDATSMQKLQLASQGTIERTIVEWRRGQIGQLHFDYSQYGMFAPEHFSVQSPHCFDINYDGVWRTTLRYGKLGEISVTRDEQQMQNFKGYLLTVLDQELWLTAQQRDMLEPVLSARIDQISPDITRYTVLKDFRSDLLLFARTVLTIPDEKVEQILSKEQLTAWKTIKKEFAINEENYITYTHRFGEWPVGQLHVLPSTEGF